MADEKTALNISIPTELKERLVRRAEELGLSQTATATILLDQALTRAGLPRSPR